MSTTAIFGAGVMGGEIAQVIAAARAQAVEKRCLEQGLLVRALGETIALSPPLVVSHAEVAQMADTLRAALRHVDAQGPAA